MQAPDGEYVVYYSTADGNSLLTGDLFASSGENLTQRHVAQFVPSADLGAVWAKFGNSSVVVSGAQSNPKSVIYAVMDPNCIFCHLLWVALRPYQAAGLQVRWLPVGFLHEDSAAKAASLLKGGDAVLTRLQERFDKQAESGGVPGIEITPELKAELDANLVLMHEGNVQGTPALLYRDAEGHVQRKQGMPRLAELPGITGLPEQPETDPQLDRFRR
jgi:thiol:disulfide interchange protein DsbG